MNKTKGLIFGILAAIIYGFTPILGKLTYSEGSNTISLAFYRGLFSIPFFLATLKYKKIPLKTDEKHMKRLAVMSFFSLMASLCLYGSYNYISVGMSTTIHYIYPVLVVAACIIVFKDEISKEKILSLIMSTIGIVMFFEGNINITGIALALISGVMFASYLLYMDKSGLKMLFPFQITFYTALFTSFYIFIFGIITKSIVFKMTFTGWLYTFLVSIFVAFIANTFVFLGVKHVGPTVTSIVGMFEPITSIIFGTLFLKEPLTFKNIIACVLILSGVLIVTLSKEKTVEADNKPLTPP